MNELTIEELEFLSVLIPINKLDFEIADAEKGILKISYNYKVIEDSFGAAILSALIAKDAHKQLS